MLSGNISRFDQKLIRCRKEILRYSHYYLQLQDVTDVLQKMISKSFQEEDLAGIRLLRGKDRTASSGSRDAGNIPQVREVYQAQIEIRQNKIMKSLTIVTAIFLPLTLIAGWYGMNFTYMPELQWEYGCYPAVVGLSVVTVLSSLALCHKKHFFH